MSASREKGPIPSRGSARPRHTASKRDEWTAQTGAVEAKPQARAPLVGIGEMTAPYRLVTMAHAPAIRRLCPETPKTLETLLWQQLFSAGDTLDFECARERTREFFPEIYAAVWLHIFDGGRC